MAGVAIQPVRSLERRILQREILKYGGSLPTESGLVQGDSIGCNNLTPQLAADATLTGFAQLAALRMNSKHGFISLIDDKYQHVLAEATRSVSPFDLSIHEPNDDLVVGVQTLDLEFGICPITLAAFSKGPDHWIDSNITYADEHKYIITDLLAEPRVNKARFMEGNNTSRFYAEVPLRNSQGMIIGSVSVIDNEPRSHPSSIDVRALEDIALMTMDHFELIRIKEVSLRAERLMQGLGHFNLGKSTISQWIMNNSGQPLSTQGQPYGIPTDSPFLTPMTLEETPTPSLGQVLAAPPLVTPSVMMERSGYFDVQPNKIIPTSVQPSNLNDTSTKGLSKLMNGTEPSSQLLPEKVEIAPSRVPADIKDAFARASNLIRESMDLDTTCFLEISPAALLNTRKRKGSIDSIEYSSSVSSAPRSTKPEAASTTSKLGLRQHTQRKDTPKLCSRLGFSTKFESEMSDDILDHGIATFPEASLCKLAYEYSAGSIFNFDAFGCLAMDDESRNDAKSLARRKKLSNLMIKHFPDARSLIFMPLYDNETRHLYAGFFGWTTDPRRSLVNNEIVYVLGFANSIMCEVMRLETLAVEKAKTDFMSSMSHELRSPLHGILGATQLLQESELPQTQRELATMIDSCGRTLLDIMNNLLEHAKINNITHAKRSGIRNGKGSHFDAPKKDARTSQDGSSELVNLASLVEETVTSVAAGHSVRQQRNEQVSARRASSRSVNVDELAEDEIDIHGVPLPPAVIIHIPHQDSWLFETEAGSWRRVVMNLVGNALKYTQRGHISVSLRSVLPTTANGNEGGVVLTVEDTGQGISESYLKNRLYTPFAQEDNLSVGAGLGLSIVNRLVEALGGTIQIESEVDVGTKVTVSVSITAVRPDHVSFVRSNSLIGFDAVRLLVENQKAMAFVGFDPTPTTQTNGANLVSRQATTLSQLKESLIGLAMTWFGVSITDDLDEASIVFIEDVYARNVLREEPSNAVFRKRCIVVNAQDSAAPKVADWPRHCNFLAAPVGPVKLSRVLRTALEQDPDIGTKSTATKRRRSSSSNNNNNNNNNNDKDSTKSPTDITNSTVAASNRPTKKLKLTNTNTTAQSENRVLLVEDNAINLKLLASFVRRLGFPYTTATNGQEALDEYTASFDQGSPIHYVLMDITMPVMDGITATRHIRAFEKAKNIDSPAEIIALTGLGHVEAQTEAMASGVDQYFCKPVKLDQLKKLLIDE